MEESICKAFHNLRCRWIGAKSRNGCGSLPCICDIVISTDDILPLECMTAESGLDHMPGSERVSAPKVAPSVRYRHRYGCFVWWTIMRRTHECIFSLFVRMMILRRLYLI